MGRVNKWIFSVVTPALDSVASITGTVPKCMSMVLAP